MVKEKIEAIQKEIKVLEEKKKGLVEDFTMAQDNFREIVKNTIHGYDENVLVQFAGTNVEFGIPDPDYEERILFGYKIAIYFDTDWQGIPNMKISVPAWNFDVNEESEKFRLFDIVRNLGIDGTWLIQEYQKLEKHDTSLDKIVAEIQKLGYEIRNIKRAEERRLFNMDLSNASTIMVIPTSGMSPKDLPNAMYNFSDSDTNRITRITPKTVFITNEYYDEFRFNIDSLYECFRDGLVAFGS